MITIFIIIQNYCLLSHVPLLMDNLYPHGGQIFSMYKYQQTTKNSFSTHLIAKSS
jgi:hypothetical protein